MRNDQLEKFVLDPDWDNLVRFMESHFDTDFDICSIDTTLHPESVTAQVVASQKIKKSFDQFRIACENVKKQRERKLPSFK
jgi:hypothetical protein